jgi:predicted adenylyl cyclase CyaB
MREVEIKSVVDDLAKRAHAIAAMGGILVFDGRLEDRRYDRPDRSLTQRDEVLRIRTYRSDDDARTTLEWKSALTIVDGYRVREEHSVAADSLETLQLVLDRLGFQVTKAIDRRIVQYELDGAVVRFERYPRMDDLVEIEGDPASIERAVTALGLPRDNFSSDGLAQFAKRYEQRTGTRAALCDADLMEPERHAADGARAR